MSNAVLYLVKKRQNFQARLDYLLNLEEGYNDEISSISSSNIDIGLFNTRYERISSELRKVIEEKLSVLSKIEKIDDDLTLVENDPDSFRKKYANQNRS